MTWNEILGPVLATSKMAELKAFIQDARKIKNVYPAGKDVFRAFDLCPYDNTRVVILGQDPYATPDTADGLAFSSRGKVRPPSLEIIMKEIYNDLNIQYFHDRTFDEFFPIPDLTNWTRLGILLLNTTLTVEEGKPGSHKGIGWEIIINAVFDALNKKEHQVLFLLWGNEAKEYESKITNSKHLALLAPHPAAELHNPTEPKKFSGCRHFSVVRDILPSLHTPNVYRTANLDSCFDKEKAKTIVKEHYPIESQKLCDYIDKDLIIHIPVNKDAYWKELRNIEASFSTKPLSI